MFKLIESDLQIAFFFVLTGRLILPRLSFFDIGISIDVMLRLETNHVENLVDFGVTQQTPLRNRHRFAAF